MRLLVLCLLIYLGYWVVKKWVLPGPSRTRTPDQESLTTVDDLMVKDPFCGTYFPKKKGIKGVINGKTTYFCSSRCRDKYLESASGGKSAKQ